MSIKSTSKHVICKPSSNTGGLKQETSRGMVHIKQANEITSLEVVFDSDIAPAGSKVFLLESDLVTTGWAKKVLTMNGNNVILVPADSVVAVERK